MYEMSFFHAWYLDYDWCWVGACTGCVKMLSVVHVMFAISVLDIAVVKHSK